MASNPIKTVCTVLKFISIFEGVTFESNKEMLNHYLKPLGHQCVKADETEATLFLKVPGYDHLQCLFGNDSGWTSACEATQDELELVWRAFIETVQAKFLISFFFH